jgi:hypothetical protein
MEETEIGEVGVDKLAEGTNEKAKEHGAQAPWLRGLALSTALFAVTAALASLESGRWANEAILQMNEAALKQTQAADSWAYYQAKGIKQVTRAAEIDLLNALNAPADAIGAARTDSARYSAEQEQSKEEAKKLEKEAQELHGESHSSLERHHMFAYAVTILQVTIGLSAIAALIELRWIWGVALVSGTVGIGFLAAGFL